MTKTAIVLFNLGGPDSKSAIEPFLMNFFLDKNIIRAPYFVRWLLAKMISKRRSKREAGTSYGELGDKSPLLANSQEQAQVLEKILNDEGRGHFKTFISMRYWHPMADEVVKSVKEWGADHIILLPLYPQYSTTTTRSSYEAWSAAARKQHLHTPATLICCYPFENGFITASTKNIIDVYNQAKTETGMNPRVLFSAHGLPEKIVEAGDPYQWQCQQTAALIAKTTGLENLDWQVCYQSRVGPMQWLKPSTEEALQKAADDKVPVIILPHAFTQEHVETLVEIEIEYREVADHLGVPGFYRVPTVGAHPDFIRGLADMVYSRLQSTEIAPDSGARLCPKEFGDCCMQQFAGKKSCCC